MYIFITDNVTRTGDKSQTLFVQISIFQVCSYLLVAYSTTTLSHMHTGGNAVETVTEADSSDITAYPHDDN